MSRVERDSRHRCWLPQARHAVFLSPHLSRPWTHFSHNSAHVIDNIKSQPLFLSRPILTGHIAQIFGRGPLTARAVAAGEIQGLRDVLEAALYSELCDIQELR